MIWLTATFSPATPETPVRVVVSKLRGLQLAIDSTIDEAEAAAHALLKAVADARAGGEPAESRMTFYDVVLIEKALHVWESREPKPEEGRQRKLFANTALTITQLAKWTRAWSDEKADMFVVTRLDGRIEVGESS